MQTAEMKRDLTHSVCALITSDIEFVSGRFEAEGGILQSMRSNSLVRKNFDDLSEILISAASTASLTGYRLEGDEWRLDAVREGTRQGVAIVSALDRLRGLMLAHQKDIVVALTRKRFLSVTAAKSLAIATVALDAVFEREKALIFSVAGIRQRSNDPVGDAQFLAEQLELAGELPGKEIKPAMKAPAADLFAGVL